jgi:hypothetical protein
MPPGRHLVQGCEQGLHPTVLTGALCLTHLLHHPLLHLRLLLAAAVAGQVAAAGLAARLRLCSRHLPVVQLEGGAAGGGVVGGRHRGPGGCG